MKWFRRLWERVPYWPLVWRSDYMDALNGWEDACAILERRRQESANDYGKFLHQRQRVGELEEELKRNGEFNAAQTATEQRLMDRVGELEKDNRIANERIAELLTQAIEMEQRNDKVIKDLETENRRLADEVMAEQKRADDNYEDVKSGAEMWKKRLVDRLRQVLREVT